MHHWASKICGAETRVRREGEEEEEVVPPSMGETMERFQCLAVGRDLREKMGHTERNRGPSGCWDFWVPAASNHCDPGRAGGC